MISESNFVNETQQKQSESELWNTFSDCVLVYDSTISKLFIAKKGGRLFILKTFTGASVTSSGQPPQMATDFALELLKREYSISSCIVHPNIAHIYSLEMDSPIGPCIVMEYVDGRNLKEFLNENPSAELRKKVFSQILGAVSEIHSHNVLHNDIKPENILVTYRENDVKVIDFGFSDDDIHYFYHNLGYTGSYASPELKSGNTDVDARSDIFSLGLIMRDIFGRRYSHIWNKCTKIDRLKRFRDVRALQRAWTHYYHPIYYATAALLICAIAFSITRLSSENRQLHNRMSDIQEQYDSIARQYDSIQILTDELQAEKLVLKASRELIDSLYSASKKNIELHYSKARDSILAMPPDGNKFTYMYNFCKKLEAMKQDFYNREDLTAEERTRLVNMIAVDEDEGYKSLGKLVKD